MICIHLVTSQGAEGEFLMRLLEKHGLARRILHHTGPSKVRSFSVSPCETHLCWFAPDHVTQFRVSGGVGFIKGPLTRLRLTSHPPPPPLTPATPQQIGSRRRFNMLSRVEAVNPPLTAANGGEGSGLPGRTASFCRSNVRGELLTENTARTDTAK